MYKLLKQIGPVNISRHHLINYKEVKKLTLRKLLTYIISPTKFKSRQKGVPATGYYRFFVIDWDGDKKGFKEITHALETGNISYLAFPSPSHWVKKGYRMRILVPISGTLSTTKEGYQAQYFAFLAEMGFPIPDKTSGDTKRLFYPPYMKHIKQVPSGDPKPADQVMRKIKKKVSFFYGRKFPVRAVGEAMEKASVITPHLFKKDPKSGKYKRSMRKAVYFDGSKEITHKGKVIGTFEELKKKGYHIRCDCPFDDACDHSDGRGADYAFLQGNKIICQGNDHADLVGRIKSPLFEVL